METFCETRLAKGRSTAAVSSKLEVVERGIVARKVSAHLLLPSLLLEVRSQQQSAHLYLVTQLPTSFGQECAQLFRSVRALFRSLFSLPIPSSRIISIRQKLCLPPSQTFSLASITSSSGSSFASSVTSSDAIASLPRRQDPDPLLPRYERQLTSPSTAVEADVVARKEMKVKGWSWGS